MSICSCYAHPKKYERQNLTPPQIRQLEEEFEQRRAWRKSLIAVVPEAALWLGKKKKLHPVPDEPPTPPHSPSALA